MHLEGNTFRIQNSHPTHVVKLLAKEGAIGCVGQCCCLGQNFRVNSHLTAGLLSHDWSFSRPATTKGAKMASSNPVLPPASQLY